MYETLQSFPSIEHYELLAKVLFHLTKPCYLPEASEFRVLVDTEYIGYWDLRQVTYLMDVNKDESDSTTDTIDDIILMLRSDDTFSLVIEKKHIIGLRINGRKIPTSIPLLKELKILFIDNEDLDELPKELTQLTKLRCIYVNKSNLKNIPNLAMMFPKLEYLGLRGVDLESTPDWLLEFARQHHTGKYTLEKPYSPLSWLYSKAVNKEDAAILGLLEILIGRIFTPDLIDDYIFYDSGGCCFYILNESGDVIGLTIGCENYANLWDYVSLSYFPEEICKLKHLKALRIWFITKRYRLLLKEEWDNNESDATDLWIPESIRGISSLSFLWTNANYSESLIPFLDSLDSFGKPLNEP